MQINNAKTNSSLRIPGKSQNFKDENLTKQAKNKLLKKCNIIEAKLAQQAFLVLRYKV